MEFQSVDDLVGTQIVGTKSWYPNKFRFRKNGQIQNYYIN